MDDDDIFNGHLVYLRSFGIFCDHLVYFVVIWYIFPVLVCCTKVNLATLGQKPAKKSLLKSGGKKGAQFNA
jgi:hypothetical protein